MKTRARLFALLLASLGLIRTAEAKVLINEIFYYPPENLDELQYVELHNDGAEAVDASGWSFTKGVKFNFPAGTTIEPNGYVVICRNQAVFAKYYQVPVAGVFENVLKRSGERIELRDARGQIVDRVRYLDHKTSPQSPGGHGSSLERICPGALSELPHNWASSPLSPDPAVPGGTPGRRNSVYAATLPPMISRVLAATNTVAAGEPLKIEAEVVSLEGLREVKLLYRVVGPGRETAEQALPMTREQNQRYTALIPGQQPGQIIRYRVRVEDRSGATRLHPGENEPRPALSCFVRPALEPAKIPFGFVLHTAEADVRAAKAARQRGSQPFSEEDIARWRVERMLRDSLDLAGLWTEVTLNFPADPATVAKLRAIYTNQLAARESLITATLQATNLPAQIPRVPEIAAPLRAALRGAFKTALAGEAATKFDTWFDQNLAQPAGPRRRGPEMMLQRVLALEPSYAVLTTRPGVSDSQFVAMRDAYAGALKERAALLDFAKNVSQDDEGWEKLMEKTAPIGEALEKKLKEVLTPDQERAFASWQAESENSMPGRAKGRGPLPVQGRSAFVYRDQATGEFQVFDFINVVERAAGYKVHLHREQPLKGMTTFNLIYEYNDRFVLAEPLAYELYHRVGNAACESGFVRLWLDGEPLGYHVLCEQPNKGFLRHNKLNDDGNLYKLIWYGRGVVGQHEKKSNPQTGHDDLVELVEKLGQTKGDAQWEVIQRHFDVDQVATYYAVNMCLSHWDGFHNNYFAYHDTQGTGKWQLYPWDQDKTWGFHDGLEENGVFWDMPLTFGMEGDKPPGWKGAEPPKSMMVPNNEWWRPGGWFGKPLLGNPKFRAIFLARLREILEKHYTLENFGPILDRTRELLREEARLRASLLKEDPAKAEKRLEQNVALLRSHLEKRREYLLKQPELQTAGR